MGKIIAICNQKGGVGKSTTAVNLGAYIAQSGKQSLLIDLDPQGNATISCGISRGSIKRHMADVMLRGASIYETILKSSVERLDVSPSSTELASVDLTLEGDDSASTLRKAIELIRDRYEMIWIDCPPSLGTLTVNAMTAADGVLVPVQCEYLALEGLNGLLKSINSVKASFNPSLTVHGILLTMTDPRTSLCHEITQDIRNFFGELVFNASIPRNVRLAECPSFGKPISLYDPHSSGALAYYSVAQEVAARLFETAMSVPQPVQGG